MYSKKLHQVQTKLETMRKEEQQLFAAQEHRILVSHRKTATEVHMEEREAERAKRRGRQVYYHGTASYRRTRRQHPPSPVPHRRQSHHDLQQR